MDKYQTDLYMDAGGPSITTTGTTPWSAKPLSLDDMERMIQKFAGLVTKSYLHIWRGDKRFNLLPTKVRPELHLSTLVPEDRIYIMAGVGIIAGEKAYDILKKSTIALVWSDEYIPLEDQPSDIAKTLLQWEVKRDGE